MTVYAAPRKVAMSDDLPLGRRPADVVADRVYVNRRHLFDADGLIGEVAQPSLVQKRTSGSGALTERRDRSVGFQTNRLIGDSDACDHNRPRHGSAPVRRQSYAAAAVTPCCLTAIRTKQRSTQCT